MVLSTDNMVLSADNTGMPDCPASGQFGTELKKLTMPELVWYRNKATQSGLFLVGYRIEMKDVGILLPALVFWMPMPTYSASDCRLINCYEALIIHCVAQVEGEFFKRVLKTALYYSKQFKRDYLMRFL
jgi:hypothetical protein